MLQTLIVPLSAPVASVFPSGAKAGLLAGIPTQLAIWATLEALAGKIARSDCGTCVGGTTVAVAGTGVPVGGMGVLAGAADVAVGRTGVFAGTPAVAVTATGVFAGREVGVDGTAVRVELPV